jgi:hypothetical protein
MLSARKVMKCNACGFRTPRGTIGAVIMKEHLKEYHPELLKGAGQ